MKKIETTPMKLNMQYFRNDVRHSAHNIKTAIGDILDNSVDGNATSIKLDVDTTNGIYVSEISIIDNGTGVPNNKIEKLKDLGNSSEDEMKNNTSELGCYGVGLKYGAFFLGNKLDIFTKTEGENKVTHVCMYFLKPGQTDFDPIIPEIVEYDLNDTQYGEFINKVGGEHGTIVKISELHKEHILNNFVREMRQYVGETYNKYIMEGGDFKDVNFYVDGCQIDYIDLMNGEKCEQVITIKPFCGGKRYDVICKVFIHEITGDEPKKHDNTVPKYKKYDADTCGMYLYRNGRLISSGESLGLWKKDNRKFGVRVEVFFDGKLDEYFGIQTVKVIHKPDGKKYKDDFQLISNIATEVRNERERKEIDNVLETVIKNIKKTQYEVLSMFDDTWCSKIEPEVGNTTDPLTSVKTFDDKQYLMLNYMNPMFNRFRFAKSGGGMELMLADILIEETIKMNGGSLNEMIEERERFMTMFNKKHAR